MRRHLDLVRKRPRLPLSIELLETRLPVSEGIGPFIAVSALSAVSQFIRTPSLMPPSSCPD